jgi:hypothetical protein
MNSLESLLNDMSRLMSMVVTPLLLLVSVILARRVGLRFGPLGVASATVWLVLSSIMAVNWTLASHGIVEYSRMQAFSFLGHLIWMAQVLAAGAVLGCFLELHRRAGPGNGEGRASS